MYILAGLLGLLIFVSAALGLLVLCWAGYCLASRDRKSSAVIVLKCGAAGALLLFALYATMWGRDRAGIAGMPIEGVFVCAAAGLGWVGGASAIYLEAKRYRASLRMRLQRQHDDPAESARGSARDAQAKAVTRGLLLAVSSSVVLAASIAVVNYLADPWNLLVFVLGAMCIPLVSGLLALRVAFLPAIHGPRRFQAIVSALLGLAVMLLSGRLLLGVAARWH